MHLYRYIYMLLYTIRRGIRTENAAPPPVRGVAKFVHRPSGTSIVSKFTARRTRVLYCTGKWTFAKQHKGHNVRVHALYIYIYILSVCTVPMVRREGKIRARRRAYLYGNAPRRRRIRTNVWRAWAVRNLAFRVRPTTTV